MRPQASTLILPKLPRAMRRDDLNHKKDGADFGFNAISGGQMVPGASWPILWSPGNGKAWIRLVDLSDSGLVFHLYRQPPQRGWTRPADRRGVLRETAQGPPSNVRHILPPPG